MSELQSTSGALRPLIIRFGALGDMVILLSLVRALHLRFGAPVDIVSSGAWNRPLLEGQPGIGVLHLIRSRKTPYWLSFDQWQLVSALRARRSSPIWNCDGDQRTRSLLAHAGIPGSHVIDAGRVARLPNEHEVDRWLRLSAMTPAAFESRCAPAQIDSCLRVPPLVIGDEERRDVDVWLKAQRLHDKPLVLIQAGNKRTTKWWRPRDRDSNTKYWPESRWASVIDAIATVEKRAEFLLCGVEGELALNRSILRDVRTRRVRNLAGELPLTRLLPLQERALGMISVDTGPAHSAGALGCPLVVLFGTAEPSMYLPRGKSGAVTCVRAFEQGRASMRMITVDEVVRAWNTLFHRPLRDDARLVAAPPFTVPALGGGAVRSPARASSD
jgi:heptosyltransferase-2/heptosyltransferase-3